ncbi:MAG: hypothetical protein JWN14_2279 [Chthonomonadales bacterium]|nr:hypothetical protein [Chthonomonadales bacterium]
MSETWTIEGTREELEEQLQAFPKEQRFRVIPLPQPEEGNGSPAGDPSLTELFVGRTGRFHCGDATLSQDSVKKFAALMAEKKRKGRL